VPGGFRILSKDELDDLPGIKSVVAAGSVERVLMHLV
jgi:hypothetical protein